MRSLCIALLLVTAVFMSAEAGGRYNQPRQHEQPGLLDLSGVVKVVGGVVSGLANNILGLVVSLAKSLEASLPGIESGILEVLVNIGDSVGHVVQSLVKPVLCLVYHLLNAVIDETFEIVANALSFLLQRITSGKGILNDLLELVGFSVVGLLDLNADSYGGSCWSTIQGLLTSVLGSVIGLLFAGSKGCACGQ